MGNVTVSCRLRKSRFRRLHRTTLFVMVVVVMMMVVFFFILDNDLPFQN